MDVDEIKWLCCDVELVSFQREATLQSSSPRSRSLRCYTFVMFHKIEKDCPLEIQPANECS